MQRGTFLTHILTDIIGKKINIYFPLYSISLMVPFPLKCPPEPLLTISGPLELAELKYTLLMLVVNGHVSRVQGSLSKPTVHASVQPTADEAEISCVINIRKKVCQYFTDVESRTILYLQRS